MNNIGKKIFFFAVFAILVSVAFFSFRTFRIRKDNAVVKIENTKSDYKESTEKAVFIQSSKIVISDSEKTQKIDLLNGKLEEASSFEQSDFSSFAGFPKLGINEREYLQISFVLKSKFADQALVQISHYDASEGKDLETINPDSLISISEYVCDLKNQKCSNSQILSQVYNGLDPSLLNSQNFSWTSWAPDQKKIFGILENEKSSVFVCDSEKKVCQKNEISEPDRTIHVPFNAFSPLLDKFVAVSHNGKIGTEKKWEVLLYDADDFSKPMNRYDISNVINDEDVDFDEVESVAWNQDEKKIAIGTTRKVFILDTEKNSLSLAYMAPSDEENEFDWDWTQLYLSPDAKFIALVDSNDMDDSEEQELESDTLNNLKKIDLESKVVTTLYSSKGLGMEL